MKEYRYIDKYYALLEGDGGSKGDAILRTFYFFKTIQGTLYHNQYKEDIARFFRSVTIRHFLNNTNAVARHPDLSCNKDASMDAMIGWILYHREVLDEAEFERIVGFLPRQISDKHRWTFPWWDWVKYHQGNSRGHWFLFCTIFMGIAYWSNWILKACKITKGSWYLNYFNVHLAAWMIWSMDNRNILRWIARWTLAVATPKSNALVRKLLKKSYNNTLNYPAKGWKWQRLPWVEYTGIDNSEISRQEAGYPIDVDILKQI